MEKQGDDSIPPTRQGGDHSNFVQGTPKVALTPGTSNIYYIGHHLRGGDFHGNQPSLGFFSCSQRLSLRMPFNPLKTIQITRFEGEKTDLLL